MEHDEEVTNLIRANVSVGFDLLLFF